jgi:hypothetical protein
MENNGNWMELALPTTGLQDLILTYGWPARTSRDLTPMRSITAWVVRISLSYHHHRLPSDWLVSGVKSIDFSSLGWAK